MGARISILTIAVLLVAASQATAAWSPPVQISSSGQGGASPQLLFDSRGTGLAAWRTLDGPRVGPLQAGGDRSADPGLGIVAGLTGGYGKQRLLTLEQVNGCGNCNPPGSRLYLRD